WPQGRIENRRGSLGVEHHVIPTDIQRFVRNQRQRFAFRDRFEEPLPSWLLKEFPSRPAGGEPRNHHSRYAVAAVRILRPYNKLDPPSGVVHDLRVIGTFGIRDHTFLPDAMEICIQWSDIRMIRTIPEQIL